MVTNPGFEGREPGPASDHFAVSARFTFQKKLTLGPEGGITTAPDHRQVGNPGLDVLNGYDSYPGLFVCLLTYSVGLGIPGNINADRLQEITNRGSEASTLICLMRQHSRELPVQTCPPVRKLNRFYKPTAHGC